MHDENRQNARLPGEQAQVWLSKISQWGPVTTIVIHGGSVFEFKGDFPEGSLAEGFYNLKSASGFEGHLNLNVIKEIQLQSKQHRGRDSHAFVFVNKSDDVVFKIFLGREENGEIIASQLDQFKAIQAQTLKEYGNEE